MALTKLDDPWGTEEALRDRALAEFDRLGLSGALGGAFHRLMERRWTP